ncbi:Acetyltransferase (GNAT) family protein [Shewanella sp. P1-14-1]|uniref:GNAT family N-acetyltransferase n=1 Tax=Shewanella sp. P1-14-1 TaxID=1723761 RepID=UPI0006D673F0|nr:GNAT family N-acetyltransferase [Shewanella sp. P1-14-1]KPZ72972.1 Acetyltransferase (GNAT) family protein [Shewanella sp. P1-14-1]
MGITAPELLTETHDLSDFDCGRKELNDWLVKKALKSQQRNKAKVYIVTDPNTAKVIGYYAVAMGSVQREAAIAALRRNSPNPIPMIVLARLAVNDSHHGKGIGVGLLKDCVKRSVHAMNVVGGPGILVHAIDDSAKKFYTRFGFKDSTFDPMVLMARVKDIEAAQK